MIPFLFIVLFCFSVGRAADQTPAASSTATPAQIVFASSLRFGDGLWDERASLLWAKPLTMPGAPHAHNVRTTLWYAYGLMMRDQPGDRERSLRAIDAVLRQQIEAPGQVFDGTFYRSPEEPFPFVRPRIWEDYDPNWRQFVGTTLAQLLLDYSDRIPAAQRARMETAIVRAVQGEIQDGRLTPRYTNIAIMHGFLWSYAAVKLNHPEWIEPAAAWADEVHRLFKRHGAFEEYNSPTYYGVDLCGLALWRKHGPTPQLRELGAEMEAALWEDIAQFYHADLRNIAGPYDRSYGMDMPNYVALTGVWLGLVLEPAKAPLVAPDGPIGDNDYLIAPCYLALEPRIPATALPHFQAFQGERQVVRRITADRTATAWIGRDIMIGGEVTNWTKAAGFRHDQFHPATIHWRTPSGSVGWVLLRQAPRVDARAEREKLTISALGTCTFRIFAPGADPARLSRDDWQLPGLSVHIETDALDFQVTTSDGHLEVTYRDITRIVLHTMSPR